METFVKGEVVIVPFPFSDMSGYKKRPALIIAKMQGEDMVLCQITGVQREDFYAVGIDNLDFDIGDLYGPSLIRANKLFTVDKKAILHKVGKVNIEKIREVENKVIELIRR